MNYIKANKNFFNNLFITGVTGLSGLFSGILLARNLSLEIRGEYAALQLWIGIFALVGDFGLSFSLAYYCSNNREKIDEAWSLSALSSLILGSFLIISGVILLPKIININISNLIPLYVGLCAIPALLMSGYISSIFLGTGKIHYFNSIRLLNSILITILFLILSIFYKLELINCILIFSSTQYIVLLTAIKLIYASERPKFKWNITDYKKILIYAFKCQFGSLSAQINLRADQLLLTNFVSYSQLALYSIAVSFSSILMLVYNSVGVLVLPFLSQAIKYTDKVRFINKLLFLSLIFTMPIIIFLFIYADKFINLLFGNNYSDAIELTRILLFAVLFQGMNVVAGNSLRALGLPGKSFVAEFIGVIFTIGSLMIFLPKYGVYSAAIISLSVYFIVFLIQVFYINFARNELNLSE